LDVLSLYDVTLKKAEGDAEFAVALKKKYLWIYFSITLIEQLKGYFGMSFLM